MLTWCTRTPMGAGSCLTIFTLWFCTGLPVLAMRGPHHPRDEKVVRIHTHYKPMPPALGNDHTKLTQDSELIQDKDHIREDMSNQVDPEVLKNMTPEEMDFYYFKLHDFDNNSQLDGLELLKAIEHTMHSSGHREHDADNAAEFDQADEANEHRSVEEDLIYFTKLIDEVLLGDDVNNDGYLSYAEYIVGKRRSMNNKTDQGSSSLMPRHLIHGPTS